MVKRFFSTNPEYRYFFRDFFILLLVLFLSILLSEKFYLKNAYEYKALDRFLVYIYFFVPFFILSWILAYVYRNWKNRKVKRLKSAIRYRLNLAFIFVALLPFTSMFLILSNVGTEIIERFYKVDVSSALRKSVFLIKEIEDKQKIDFINTIFLQTQKEDYLKKDLKEKILAFEKIADFVIYLDNDKVVRSNLNFHFSLQEFQFYYTQISGWQKASLKQNKEIIFFLKIPHKSFENNFFILGKKFFIGNEQKILDILKTEDAYSQINLSEEDSTYLRLIFGIFAILTFLVSLIFSFLFSRRLSSPIIELANATKKVSQGEFDVRLKFTIKEDDEIGVLVDSFNQMIKDLKIKNQELKRTERIAAWKEVAQRMAHEIKNPLTPIQLNAERIRRNFEQKKDIVKLKEVIEKGTTAIINQVKVLQLLVSEFSDFARMPASNLSYESVNPIIKDSVKLFGENEEIKFKLKLHSSPPKILIDKKLFLGVLNNLIKNSVESIFIKKAQIESYIGLIQINTYISKNFSLDYFVILIEDNGCGIDDKIKDKIFEPYFSTKQKKTSGIGLAVVQKIISEHNGNILIENRNKYSGCKVKIEIPIY